MQNCNTFRIGRNAAGGKILKDVRSLLDQDDFYAKLKSVFILNGMLGINYLNVQNVDNVEIYADNGQMVIEYFANPTDSTAVDCQKQLM